jgi:hypothetical protein
MEADGEDTHLGKSTQSTPSSGGPHHEKHHEKHMNGSVTAEFG